jgi:hypothetical protein
MQVVEMEAPVVLGVAQTMAMAVKVVDLLAENLGMMALLELLFFQYLQQYILAQSQALQQLLHQAQIQLSSSLAQRGVTQHDH